MLSTYGLHRPGQQAKSDGHGRHGHRALQRHYNTCLQENAGRLTAREEVTNALIGHRRPVELGFEKWKEVSRERSEAKASQKQGATGVKSHLGHVALRGAAGSEGGRRDWVMEREP